VPLFNTGSCASTFREEVAENVEGAPGSTFIVVKGSAVRGTEIV